MQFAGLKNILQIHLIL